MDSRGKSVFWVAIAVILAVYLNYPGPELSEDLTEFKNKGQFMKYGEHSIFYTDTAGTGKGILLCLHGYPSSSYDWQHLLPKLSLQFRRVITADFLGFGFSDKPYFHSYTISEQADVIEHILKSLKVLEVHILSHDYGDTVAQELIHRHEHRLAKSLDATHPKITSLCLSNGGVFPQTNFPTTMQKLLTTPVIRHIIPFIANHLLFKRGFSGIFGPKTKPTDRQLWDYWTLQSYNKGTLIAGSIMEYCVERRIGSNTQKWVGSLQKTHVPVHMIYGPADPVNPTKFIEFFKETLPKASIDVLGDDIGHYPQLEDPKNFLVSYERFLGKIRRINTA